MVGVMARARRFGDALDTQRRIVWALLMRELSTRYGRDDLGFLWVIIEPMIFAGAVSVLWSIVKPPFESGIRIVPFTVTGYLPLILVRQTIGFSATAIRVNEALLYHRQITPLHLFIARFGIEAAGISLAYVIIVTLLNIVGMMTLPKNILQVLGGWFLLTWMSFGLALMVGAIATVFEFVERVVQVITYILIPLSGAFYMASSLPPVARHYVLYVPFIHCFEMMRGGFFGEFITTYYDPWYAVAWAAGMTLVGLVLVQFVRGRVDVQ
jgi:capsular polysaccharide transport system permease protein